MRSPLLIFGIGLLLLNLTPVFAINEKLADSLVQTEVKLMRDNSLIKKAPLLVAFRITGRGAERVVHGALLRQVVLASLSNAGIRSRAYEKDLILDLKQNVVEPRFAISPKLIVDVRIVWNEAIANYESENTISYVEYHQRPNKAEYHAVIKWQKTQQISGFSGQEIEENLIKNIQQQVKALRPILADEAKAVMATPVNSGGSSEKSAAALSYRTKWIDPDPRRGRFFTGVSVGTPALFNLNLGYWGTTDLPLVFNVSAMYIDATNRGLQTDIGWAIDNEGAFKHGVGASLSWLTQQSTNQSQSLDVLGRVTSLQQTTNNTIRPFVGPTYFFDFHNVHLQVGAALPIAGDGSSAPRFLFQIGFIPPIGL